MSAPEYTIGIDIGGTVVKAVRVSREGDVLARDRFETRDDATSTWADRVRDYVLATERDHGPAVAVGVASPGLARRDERAIAWMMGRMAGVVEFDWTKHLQRGDAVPVLNDAHAALLGEAWIGAAAGALNVVLLTLGTGVGGAILCDGRLLRGHLGRAGHLGHLSLNPDGPRDIVSTPGSIEDAIGECTLQARCGGAYASTKDLVAAYRAGDTRAEKIWLDSVRALAAAMASIINAVDPETIILGGGIAQAGDALLDPLRTYLDQFEWRPTGTSVQLVFAKLGDHAGAIGAARRALEKRYA